MDDLSLRDYVLSELEFEPSVNAAHIGVAVDDGVVTLSGHVGSYAEKLAAEKIVQHLKSVRAIAEEMGLSGEQIEGLYMAAKIHDIGKIAIPAESYPRYSSLESPSRTIGAA